MLVAHLSLQGATLGFEQSIMLGRDVTVDRDELHAPRLRLYRAGPHPQASGGGNQTAGGLRRQPGARRLRRGAEDKGYIVVTIEPTRGRHARHALGVRQAARAGFATLRFEALGDEPLEQVTRDIENAAGEVLDAIVRCYVQVETGREKSVPAQEVRRQLLAAGAAQVAHVVVEASSDTGRGSR